MVDQGTVPAAAAETRVDLERGGHVMVRRMPRSRMTSALQAAGVRSMQEDAAGAAAFQMLVFQWAVTGGEGVTDDGGRPVKVSKTSHAALGRICAVEVYDALSDADIAKVVAVALGGAALTEEQQGNS